MSLILVVEPDSRHAAQLASIARNHLHAELVMAESGDRAVAALAHRVPDIVLTAPLLPHHDEAVLSDYLRGLGEAGAHVQTLTIPILSAPTGSRRAGRGGRFRRERPDPQLPDGCDPALFAEQVGQYLHSARQRRIMPKHPAVPPITFDQPIVQPVISEIVPVAEEEDPDIDLTSYLEDIAEPEPPRRRMSAAAEPTAIQRIARAEPTEPTEPTEPIEPPEPIVEAELVLPPARASCAKAPSRSDVALPQVIHVPAAHGGGGHAPSTVSVAVAVSVQVASQPVAPAPERTRSSNKPPKPVQDEWGFFDPNQCGFQALLARLDAIAADEDKE